MSTIYITESQVKAIKEAILKNKRLLNESSGDKALKKYIREYTMPFFAQYMDVPLRELERTKPEFKMYLNPSNEECEMYKRVADNQTGNNKLFDYLRINFYEQFGMSHSNGPSKYLKGVARIALAELGFYNNMQTKKIIKFGKMLRDISHNPEILERSGIVLDGDLNGMNYNQFVETISPAIQRFQEEMRSGLNAETFETPTHYTIHEIKDKSVGQTTKMYEPTRQSYNYLLSLEPYADWCIIGDRHPGMYGQYTSNGGRFYVCEKEGFQDIPKEPGENCPLDEYGLSLICVLVGEDGWPENITTRWNHDYGGENHKDLCNARQLQNILGVKYFDVFKPRNEEELSAVNIREEKKVKAAQEQVPKVNAGIMDAITMGGTMEEESIKENSYDRKINNYIKEKYGITDFNDIRQKVIDVYKKIPYARIDGGRYLIGVFRLLYDENLPKEQYPVLNKILYSIGKYSRFAPDCNLEGMSFEELKSTFFKKEFDLNDDFGSYEKQIKCKNGYTVTRIDSFEECELRCDDEWCISNDRMMWDDVGGNGGGTVYIVENEELINRSDEFEETHPEKFHEKLELCCDEEYMEQEGYIDEDGNFTYELGSGKFPYDDYGLSRFVVVVWGKAFSVYSRYNIPNCLDGDYLSKEEIESLLGVKFESVFKNIKDNVEEGAEPGGSDFVVGPDNENDISQYYHVGELNEKKEYSQKDENTFKKYFTEIGEFMDKNGLKVKPLPNINFDWSEQDGLFIRTGFYSPEEKSMTVFCKDRHPKDILRSIAHEYVHHAQNLGGKNLNFTSDDDVKDNKELEKLESEAYLKGNIYFRKWTEYKQSERKSINEGVDYDSDMDEIISPDEVDLSSFNLKKNLNPKFWKNNLLDSRIRMKLLDIAYDFIEFLGVDWVKPDDVIMTGSLANYNWNKKYSDVDLHILIDFSKVDERKDFVKKYFDSLKNQWNEEHENLTIFGFPVELYVQDTNEIHSSTGVYSIDKNKWVTYPSIENLKSSKIDKDLIKDKVAMYVNRIDKLCDIYKNSDGDEYAMRKISEQASSLIDKIKNERKKSLDGGKKCEISNGNLIFKCLRRMEYIDKLYALKNKTYDEMNSLP